MLDKIIEYSNYKFMLAGIFAKENHIVEKARQNKQFKDSFYTYDNLIKLLEILRGSLGFEMFDSEKIETIKKAMKYYIKECKEENQEVVGICKKILWQTMIPFRKSTDDFYKQEYETRYKQSCNEITEEIKQQIDAEMINDSYNLSILILYMQGETVELEYCDIPFLHSINTFIDECPEILYEDKIYEYIDRVIDENKLYQDDKELQRLNSEITDLFEKLIEDDKILSEQLMMQAYFSLIFIEDINASIKEFYSSSRAEDVFNQDILNILYSYIAENQDTCMFDSARLNNLRTLLLAFHKEGILSNQKLNELKVLLNKSIDIEYERKNQEFYISTLEAYNSHLSQKVLNYNKTKNLINIFIQNTGQVMSQLLEISIDSKDIADDNFISFYLNYLMDKYPLIRENPIYIDRIMDILLYNDIYLKIQQNKDDIAILSNRELQEKINKLRK